MRRPSLQSTLLLPLIGVLVLGSVALGVWVHRSVETDLLASVDDELERSMLAQVGRGPGGEPRPGPGGDEVVENADTPQQVAVDPSGAVTELVAGSEELAERDLEQLAVAGDPATLDGSPPLRALAASQPDGSTLVVALSLEQVDATLSTLGGSLAIGVGVLIVVQAAIAVAVVRFATRPLSRLGRQATLIAGGDLDAPVGEPAGPREVAELTDDLSLMVDRLRITIADREVAAEEAERARADMERFMADASHELRTPLTAIRGYSELYESGALEGDDLERAMSRVGSESQRLVDLVEDLLGLLRPTDPRRVRPVDLEAIASAVVHDLRAAHPHHDVSIKLEGGAGCWVQGDPQRLHQAALNLGANACQHTPKGTAVEVAVSIDAELVVLTVCDNGPGIDADTARSVFEPFVQADESRGGGIAGAGLGLSITRRIAEQHGGTVELDSSVGQGTLVILGLPRVEVPHTGSEPV